MEPKIYAMVAVSGDEVIVVCRDDDPDSFWLEKYGNVKYEDPRQVTRHDLGSPILVSERMAQTDGFYRWMDQAIFPDRKGLLDDRNQEALNDINADVTQLVRAFGKVKIA